MLGIAVFMIKTAGAWSNKAKSQKPPGIPEKQGTAGVRQGAGLA
jgi:hypothetical protein